MVAKVILLYYGTQSKKPKDKHSKKLHYCNLTYVVYLRTFQAVYNMLWQLYHCIMLQQNTICYIFHSRQQKSQYIDDLGLQMIIDNIQ